MILSKKCTCGRNNKLFCSVCSKIKMVANLVSGSEDVKPSGRTGKYNPVRYSILKHNQQPEEKIMQGMYRRALEDATIRNFAQNIQFYDNQTKTLITTITASR